MRTTLPLALAGCLLALSACRRADVRDYTLEIPGLTESNKVLVVEALAKYNGIEKDSYVWDFANRKLSLRYDSMQLAKTNIRMAIEAKGIAVVNPPIPAAVTP